MIVSQRSDWTIGLLRYPKIPNSRQHAVVDEDIRDVQGTAVYRDPTDAALAKA